LPPCLFGGCHLFSWRPNRAGRAGSRDSAATWAAVPPAPAVWEARRPLRADDRIKLSAQQLLIGENQIEKSGQSFCRGIALIGSRHVDESFNQALIVCRSSLRCAILILRGLAFSATGMVRVRAPPS
jgi:hypothetical protein